jgi:hypothetical protein
MLPFQEALFHCREEGINFVDPGWGVLQKINAGITCLILFCFICLDKQKVCHAIKQKTLPFQEALFHCREEGIGYKSSCA